MINDGCGDGAHGTIYAIIGSLSQPETCDNRDCDNRKAVSNARMADNTNRPEIRTHQKEAVEVFTLLDEQGIAQRELAAALEIDENKISKVRGGQRKLTASEYTRAMRWLHERTDGALRSDNPVIAGERAYVSIEVLPTYAGAGGGGSGDADAETALVPRSLIEDELRGKPADFILINVRGDSMEPDFRHGDQLLVDRRDTSPAQPGPFALWDGDWGEYVVKNVERSRSGDVRIFSSNPKYSSEAAPAETTRIIGRPVWFGRRL